MSHLLARLRSRRAVAAIGLGVALWAGAIVAARTAARLQAEQSVPSTGAVMPRYDADRALVAPADYRQWIVAGSSLGLSYTEGAPGGAMFHQVLIEPTAYRHFVETGSFREGTMFALLLQGTGQGVLPGRHGQFASDVHGLEMTVKDASRVPEGWAYYNFGGMERARPTAQPMPKESCYSCHAQHAARDNVFLQFYPLLAQAARVTTAAPSSPADVRSSEPVALRGLDPVLLIDGREELGKPEIVASHAGRRYQFVSEPTRARFAAEPSRYAIQNDTCPVVPGAPINPSLFAVYVERVYAFATEDCVQRFKAHPTDYVKPR